MIAAPSRAREAWLRLNAAGARPDKARELVRAVGCEGVFAVDEPAWAGALERARAFDVSRELAEAERRGIRVLTWDEPGYPELLRSVADAPLALYAWGGPLEGDAFAVVGSRRPTPYGRRMARAFARDAAAGAAVVSGLARGVDAEAHQAALEAGGRTWAVLGSGLLSVYPPENEPLARRIREAGWCLVSEYPLATPPLPAYFPARNRIVSGLSWGVVVIEGREKSGSLITARIAGEQGREVFAVPGPADSPLSEAPHLLLSEGARLARSMEDVWPELPPGCRPGPSFLNKKPGGPARPGGNREKILQSLGSESRSIEELVPELGLDFAAISNILLELELEGAVEAFPGQRYGKKGS